MQTTIEDLEKIVSLGLATTLKKSQINFNQLFIRVDIADIISTILFLKTNEKCRFKQLIDITAVDYPEKEKRFKIIYVITSACQKQLNYLSHARDHVVPVERFNVIRVDDNPVRRREQS